MDDLEQDDKQEGMMQNVRHMLQKWRQNDVPSSEEIVQVVMFLLVIISEVDDSATARDRNIKGQTIDAAKKEATAMLRTAKTLIREAEERVKIDIKTLKNFKKKAESSDLSDSVREAVSRCKGVESQIKDLQERMSLYELLSDAEDSQDEEKATPEEGKPGLAPEHEWNGTYLRFKKPDGTWGEWMNLQGPPGGGGSGPEGLYIERITTTGSSGPATLSAGGTLNIPQYTGGAGSAYTLEVPTGAINDSNVTFDFTEEPLEIVVNGLSYRKGAGWTWAGSTATLSFPVGTGGDIYGRMV